MNKAELIQAVSERTQEPKSIVEKILNTEHQVIKDTVATDNSVGIVGFGTYESREQAEREYTVPNTKEKKLAPAKMVPKFQAAKSFKDDVASRLQVKGK